MNWPLAHFIPSDFRVMLTIMANITLNIDLAALKDIVGLGARRASAFMCLGLRSAADTSILDLSLDSRTQVQFFERDVPIEVVREAQSNFRIWIIGNGLRELDQAMSIFCDQLFEVLRLLDFNKKPIPPGLPKEISDFSLRTGACQESFVSFPNNSA
ncbi:MAG: hypothetical protein ABJA75_13055 [Bradyrhizobium sp.]